MPSTGLSCCRRAVAYADKVDCGGRTADRLGYHLADGDLDDFDDGSGISGSTTAAAAAAAISVATASYGIDFGIGQKAKC